MTISQVPFSIHVTPAAPSWHFILDADGNSIAIVTKIEDANLFTAAPKLLEFAKSIVDDQEIPTWLEHGARRIIAEAERE